MDEIPFFVKAGSILPFIREETEYASQTLTSPLLFKIYGGADAVLDFYEDEGEGYSYEEGNYALGRLLWNDKDTQLTVGERVGHFDGGELDKGFEVKIIHRRACLDLFPISRPILNAWQDTSSLN